jgi:hypothetical protein
MLPNLSAFNAHKNTYYTGESPAKNRNYKFLSGLKNPAHTSHTGRVLRGVMFAAACCRAAF